MTGNRIACQTGDHCRPANVAEVVAHVAQHRVSGGARKLADGVWALVAAEETRRAVFCGRAVGNAADRFRRWFEKACSPYDAIRLPAELVGPFCRATGNTELVEFIAREAGGVFVPLPTVTGAHADILAAQLAVVRELGDQARALDAMLADKRVDGHEIASFEREVDDVIAALVAMKATVRATAEQAVAV